MINEKVATPNSRCFRNSAIDKLESWTAEISLCTFPSWRINVKAGLTRYFQVPNSLRMRIAKTKVENKQAGQQRRSAKTTMVVRHSSCESSVAIMIWGRER